MSEKKEETKKILFLHTQYSGWPTTGAAGMDGLGTQGFWTHSLLIQVNHLVISRNQLMG